MLSALALPDERGRVVLRPKNCCCQEEFWPGWSSMTPRSARSPRRTLIAGAPACHRSRRARQLRGRARRRRHDSRPRSRRRARLPGGGDARRRRTGHRWRSFVGVRDLELIRSDAWPAALAALAGPPLRATVVEPAMVVTAATRPGCPRTPRGGYDPSRGRRPALVVRSAPRGALRRRRHRRRRRVPAGGRRASRPRTMPIPTTCSSGSPTRAARSAGRRPRRSTRAPSLCGLVERVRGVCAAGALVTARRQPQRSSTRRICCRCWGVGCSLPVSLADALAGRRSARPRSGQSSSAPSTSSAKARRPVTTCCTMRLMVADVDGTPRRSLGDWWATCSMSTPRRRRSVLAAAGRAGRAIGHDARSRPSSHANPTRPSYCFSRPTSTDAPPLLAAARRRVSIAEAPQSDDEAGQPDPRATTPRRGRPSGDATPAARRTRSPRAPPRCSPAGTRWSAAAADPDDAVRAQAWSNLIRSLSRHCQNLTR